MQRQIHQPGSQRRHHHWIGCESSHHRVLGRPMSTLTHHPASPQRHPSLDLLHLPKLIFERGAVTTSRWITPCNHWWQRMHHLCPSMPLICSTFLSRCWTAELSPPKSELPQLTTDPSSRTWPQRPWRRRAPVPLQSFRHHNLDCPMTQRICLPG